MIDIFEYKDINNSKIMKILVFDTETTGLPKNQSSSPTLYSLCDWPYIVQFSYIVYDTDKNAITTLVDKIIKVPSNIKISKVSTEIHGITDKISQSQGHNINETIINFVNTLKKVDILVAHNITFDTKMLITEILRMPQKTRSEVSRKDKLLQSLDISSYYCTMKQSINLCKIKSYTKKENKEYFKYPTQTELCSYLFGYEPINMHNSLNDITICLRSFYKMKYNKDICEESEDMKNRIALLTPTSQ